jgi:hypothetical protein
MPMFFPTQDRLRWGRWSMSMRLSACTCMLHLLLAPDPGIDGQLRVHGFSDSIGAMQGTYIVVPCRYEVFIFPSPLVRKVSVK